MAYTALPSTSSINKSWNTDSSAPETLASNSDQWQSGPEMNIPRKWAYISDTVVRLATLEEVLKAKAYICMYERI